MGKGFNNYMCKKFFHPASRDNLKRVWMAEQKTEAYKKRQDELRMQYEKEQDLYNNRALLSKESKDKLSVNFLYEPPPGAKKEREREDDEPEYKFEWQRKYNAPREDYCKNNSEIRDQPFGILVRNVRCIKCHKWGHINTDRECPLFNQTPGASDEQEPIDANSLVQQMRDDGLALKKSAMSAQQHVQFPSQDMIESDEEDGANKIQKDEIDFLKSLSTKQKQKLLKKLEKLEKKNKKKKKNQKKEKKSENSNVSDSSSEGDKRNRKRGPVDEREKINSNKAHASLNTRQHPDTCGHKRKNRDEQSNRSGTRDARSDKYCRERGINRDESPRRRIKQEDGSSSDDCVQGYTERRRSRSVEKRTKRHPRECNGDRSRMRSRSPLRQKIKQEPRDSDSETSSEERQRLEITARRKDPNSREQGSRNNVRNPSPAKKTAKRYERHSDTDSGSQHKHRRRSRSIEKSRDRKRSEKTEQRKRQKSTS